MSSTSLSNLFSSIKRLSANPDSLNFVVFQAILLARIAGDKHVILHTNPEDVSAVAKIAISTLTSVFALSVRQLRLRSRRTAGEHIDATYERKNFLSSLLLLTGPPSEDLFEVDEETAQAQWNKARRRNRSRSQSRRHKSKSQTRQTFTATNSTDFPGSLTSAPSRPRSSLGSPYNFGHAPELPHWPSAVVSRYPTRRSVVHSYSDPLTSQQQAQSIVVPSSIIITGLENASVVIQKALEDVLRDRRIVLEASHFGNKPGYDSLSTDERRRALSSENFTLTSVDGASLDGTWNLPDDFLVIYVCASEGKERPNIHKSLLDKFALSTAVCLEPGNRQILTSPSTSPALTSPAVFPSTLSNDQLSVTMHPPYHFQGPLFRHRAWLPLNNEPLFPLALMETLRAAYRNVSVNPRVTLYLYDLLSATRHTPILDGTLLTARVTKNVLELAKANCVLSPEISGMDFLRPVQEDDKTESQLSIPSKQDALVEYDTNEDAGIAIPLYQEADPFDHFSRFLQASSLDLTEKDVALVYPRAVSHRLRIREREVLSSLFSSAVGEIDEEHEAFPSKSVKEYVVDILKQV